MAKKPDGKLEPFTAETFLRDVPLYAARSALDAPDEILNLYRGFTFDGHCPGCGKQATFVVPSNDNAALLARKDQETTTVANRKYTAICTRNNKHQHEFFVRVLQGRYTKVGQYPSLADIVIEENRKYRTVLSPIDGQEFYKAVGLAAHGVGIGSFVYLRRIFERLVNGRFNQHAQSEKWNEEDFAKLRMNEKVAFLQNHLPRFLVENSKVYSILSVGIHELDDDTCLGFFPVLKDSIGMILEEDWQAKEEQRLKDEAAKALAKFQKTAPTEKPETP